MKAVSPVIATVIIVAVAIVLAITVALWITGITTTFTGFERLEIVNAYSTYNTTTSNWNIRITIKNTGTRQATIDSIFINDQPLTSRNIMYRINNGSINTKPADNLNIIVDTGNIVVLWFDLNTNEGYTNGQTISIIIHTSSGGRYPVTITLP